MEINLDGDLPASNDYTHILTTCDVFSQYLFAVPLRQPSNSPLTHALLEIFAQHAYVPKHILTDRGFAFTSDVLTELMSESGIKINHATLKHEQIIVMFERNHEKLEQILKISKAADKPH